MAMRTAELIPPGALVLMLGDAAYELATAEVLASCYAPTWGRHLSSTLAVAGNHEYVAGSTAAFHDYFGDAAPAAGYFARRFDDWLVIGLDSEPDPARLDEQYAWLEATLASNEDAACVLAMWHHPLFSSGLHRGSGRHMQRFHARLDAFGADVVLNGHEHFYEAFEPQDAEGRRAERGIRNFVVGTGGARLHGFWRPPYHSRSRILRHGVLQMSLLEGSYSWRFVDVSGGSRDPGEARCRRSP
jgi:hypothetical protein